MTTWSEQPSLRRRFPVTTGQKIMLAVSLGLLIGSAIMLRWAVPKLPAQIMIHYSNLTNGGRLGPPTDLWTQGLIPLALWTVLGLLAWRLPESKLKLNGMPSMTDQNAEQIFQATRGLFLAFQLIVTLLLCGELLGSVVRGFGGLDLTALTLFPIAAFPIVIGYFLYKSSYSPRRS